MKVRWLLLATLPLGGCMTSGTNMHGDFACRAPNGTCAPMSVIDAKAIEGMAATAQPVGSGEIRTLPREGRVVTATTGGLPSRTSDRVLRVVFPAHIDASGIYHDAATAHAVVEPAGWSDRLTGRSSRPVEGATKQPAPVASDSLATLDEVVAAKGARVVLPVDAAPGMAAPAESDGMMPAAWNAPSRDPSAMTLREAVAGAGGGTIAELDGAIAGSFDTPDVTAALAPAAAGTGSPTNVLRFKTVRWRGRKVRVPIKGRPSSVVTAAGSQSVRSLNLSTLGRSGSSGPTVAAATVGSVDSSVSVSAATVSADRASTVTTGHSTRRIAGAGVEQVAVEASKVTMAPVPAPVAVPPKAIVNRPPPTKSAAIAAARVRAMAAPVIAGGITAGREQAAAEATTDVNSFTALVTAGSAPPEPRQ